jgi:hypothetical protein
MEQPYNSTESIFPDSDINSVVSTLKQNIRNHSYIDKVAGFSPNFKRSRHSQLRPREYNMSITTSKNTKKYIPYEPGKFKCETAPKLKKILQESDELKTFQIKNWLKRKVQFDKFKEPDENGEDTINVK